MEKIIVDQRELEYLLSIPVKVIERYSSERYWRDWRAKPRRVKVPPIPMIEIGAHTKRFVIADVVKWLKEFFSGPEARAEWEPNRDREEEAA